MYEHFISMFNLRPHKSTDQHAAAHTYTHPTHTNSPTPWDTTNHMSVQPFVRLSILLTNANIKWRRILSSTDPEIHFIDTRSCLQKIYKRTHTHKQILSRILLFPLFNSLFYCNLLIAGPTRSVYLDDDRLVTNKQNNQPNRCKLNHCATGKTTTTTTTQGLWDTRNMCSLGFSLVLSFGFCKSRYLWQTYCDLLVIIWENNSVY